MSLRLISSTKPPLNPKGIAASLSFFSTFGHQNPQCRHDDFSFQSLTDDAHWTKHIHKLCTVDRNVDSALELLKHICLHGYRLNALNIGSIIHGLCDAGRFAEAHHQLLLFVNSQSNILDERTCNVLVARLLYAGTPNSTLRVICGLISDNPYFVPSLINYNRLIHQICALSMPVEAHCVFFDLRKRGHLPNAVSYTSLMAGYCGIGQMDNASKLFDEMRDCGVKPSAVTYSVLIGGFLRKRDVEMGRYFLEKLWEFMANEEVDKLVNNAAFGNVINCLCKEGLFHEVFKVAEDMPQSNSVPEEFAYGEMINALCKYGRYNGAARIVYMMRKRGFTPSQQSYNTILHGLCVEGDCFRAYQLLEEGLSFGYRPSEFTYNHLVEGLCHQCDIVKAKEVVNIMLRNVAGEHKTRIYNIYLRALCFMDNPTELLNVLVSMLQEQCHPDVITLNTVVKGLCRMRRIPDASRVLKDMMSGKFSAPDVVTFTTFISGLLDAGNIEEAIDMFQNVMPAHGIRPAVATYNVLIRGLFNMDQVDEAMRSFNSMATAGVAADCKTYAIVIDGLCHSERIDEAKRLWEEVIWPSKIHDNYVYSAMLKGLCRICSFDEACDFLYELVDCGVALNQVNYNILIDYACRLGLKKEAYQICGEMKKNSVTPDSVTWRLLDKLHGNAKNQPSEDFNREYAKSSVYDT